jgi:DNA invertase Pin-like site-specific DNA recombinase
MLRGERCGHSKLTEEAIRQIRKARADGISQREIAGMFGVTDMTIHAVLSGKTWKHVA